MAWRSRTDDPGTVFVREVYAEHGDALLGHALRLCGDRGRAEDIVQETVLRAWRHAERLETDDRPLRPWLFTVASRLAIDEHRARAARPAEVGADVTGLETGGRPAAGGWPETGSDELDRRLDVLQIADALNALSPPHRAVIVETYYRGRTVAEAAAVLGVPPGTVKSRVFYGLRALRDALEERGWTP
jgi:RNA polymerase sigma-70 factor (ECF subfamily)